MAPFPRAALLLLLAVPAQAACPVDAFRAALGGGRIEAVTVAAREIRTAATCPAAERAWAGRVTALAHALAARRALGAGDTAGAVALTGAGLEFGRPWQVLAARGDALQALRGPDGRADWTGASAAYQEALTELADTGEAENPATPAQVEHLLRQAQQTTMLATEIVEPPRTRGGRRGGLALTSVRGFAITAVPQPIHFVFGTSGFTPLGAQAAERLLAMLDEEGRPAVLLVGHTDPVGSDEANDRLSRERAEAVRRFLVGRGYDPVRIATEGRGRREPMRIDGGVTYEREEMHQILRRVELVRR